MNIKLYNAVIAQLRANAIRELAELESLLASKVKDDTVQIAVARAQSLVQSEGAIHTMQQYFQPRPAPPPPAPPAPAAPAGPPKKITEEMSATYKKSIAAEKKRKKAEEDRIKRESAAKSKATKAKKESKDE